MDARRLRWPVERRLDLLLQTPAHRVLRVLRVTQAQWEAADALTAAQDAPPRSRRAAGARPEAIAA